MSDIGDTIEGRVKKAVQELSEYVDTVHIVVTWRTEDGTGDWEILSSGDGNIYARTESLRRAVMWEDERTKRKDQK